MKSSLAQRGLNEEVTRPQVAEEVDSDVRLEGLGGGGLDPPCAKSWRNLTKEMDGLPVY